MKKKEKVSRVVRLSIRLSDEDKARLQKLRLLLSPYAPLSEGKTISAVLLIAEKELSKK
jgi:hypothetical protein